MAKNLVIIESPNKVETLKKYLGKDYDIISTVGHIRDLKRFSMGFNTQTFEPEWVIQPKNKFKKERSKKEIIAEMKLAAHKAEKIYLASDPDREGEAIAWHVFDVLDKDDQEKAVRITFNEITEDAVLEAIKNPRKIDKKWVESQFTRRIFDRMIGYRLSKLVKKTLRADSAGRVQSVALMFIEDREKEIEKFVPVKWWTLDITLESDISIILRSLAPNFNVEEFVEGKEQAGIDFKSLESVNAVKAALSNKYELYAVDEPEFYARSPREPYKTSTLQQDAVNKLGWQSKKIMSVAQKLYEGVGEGDNHRAYISYPRTDSTRLSDTFIEKTRKYILNEFGQPYLNSTVAVGKEKSAALEANTQNAHEAIRPTDVKVTPDKVKDQLSKDEYSLYKLIWIRTVSAFMTPSKFKRVTLRFNNNGFKFYAFTRELVFDGYRKIYVPYKNDDSEKLINISEVQAKKVLESKETLVNEHQTKAPPRYTQATLVGELEDSGVGRPSTYATMANVCIDRGYAELVSRAFVPTEQGRRVANVIHKFFPDVINKDFTKQMEEQLDEVADGKISWKEPLKKFWPTFNEKVDKIMDKLPPPENEEVGRSCPLCGKPLIYRFNHKGQKFIGCSGFPSCKYLEPLVPAKVINEKCPDCGHDLVERKNRRGQIFIGCSNYPNCKFIGNYDKDGKVQRHVPKIKKIYNKVDNQIEDKSAEIKVKVKKTKTKK